MTNLVEFPNLGLSLEVSRVAFTIFGVPIYWYGVLIGIGMLLAVLFAFRQAPRYGISVERMIDVIFIGFVLAIVGGRAYYVLFVDFQYRGFLELIDLRSGGIAIYGAVIGAFVGALVGSKLRRVPVLPLFDLVGMGFLIGQSIGRWGNFTNQEAFGDNTNNLFGMISPATVSYLQSNQAALAAKGIVVDPAAPVHPTFLYESLWCALGFLLIFLYSKRRRFNGEQFLFYIIWYGAGRFVIEGMRTDPLMLGSFRVSQLLALTSAAAALLVWVMARVRTAGKPLVIPEIPPTTRRVTVETPDGPAGVVISWPGDSQAPSKAQLQAMALTVWEATRAEKAKAEVPEETGGEAPGEAPEEEKAEPDAPEPEKTETETFVPEEANEEKPAAEAEAAPEAARPETAKPPAKKPAARKKTASAAKKQTAKPATEKKSANAKAPAAKKPKAGESPPQKSE